MYKVIPEYENYAISKSGVVKRISTNRRIKPQRHGDYLHVTLCTNGIPKIELVHRLVAKTFLGSIQNMFIDHKNFVTTDNRVSNLQICTKQQNAWKARMVKPTASGLKGVVQVSKRSWKARIWYDGKIYHLGCYPSKEEAGRVYNREAKKRFGKYAVINSFN